MGLLKIVLAFVLLAPICQTHQTDHSFAKLLERMMSRPAPTRTPSEIPNYVFDVYKQGLPDDMTDIHFIFRDPCYERSCYSFHEQGKTWTESRQECKKKGGDLVSIETNGEWRFLKNKIQGLINPFNNEWYIGLKKEGATWKWVNGAPLTISRWQVTESVRQPSGDGPYVVMAKDFPKGTKGLFNDLPNWMKKGCICETTQGHLFTFSNTMDIQPSEKIKKARLRFLKRRSKLRRQQGKFEITVSRLTIPWEKDDQQWKRALVNVVTKTVAWRENGKWIDLDVTSAVKYWTKYKSKNYGLWMSVRGDGVPSSDFKVSKGGKKDSFLVVVVSKQQNPTEGEEDDARDEAEGADDGAESLQSLLVRKKATRVGKSGSKSCSLHNGGFVNTRDLGWHEWIIEPRSFSASYCTGTCANGDIYSSSHAVMQKLLASRRKVPEPCCRPKEFEKTSVLYFNKDDEVKFSKWNTAAASKCGC